MNLTTQIAKHFRDVHFGGNWTYSNLKEHLENVTWQQATTKIDTFNTIAVLVFHMNYYVEIVIKVLEDGPLVGNDKLSFDHPPIHSQEDWEQLVNKTWSDAVKFALLVEQMPEERLWEVFSLEKYGNYYRNIHGVIEHCHYHLGQIVIIKKLLTQKEEL
jgi:hypothetical protein